MTALQLIELTVKHTVSELKRAGLIRENRLNSFQKTERILYLYPKIKQNVEKYNFDGTEVTREFIQMIDETLQSIGDDPYYEIIPMKYFERKTHEQIAEYFNVQPAAISKQRTRLINSIRGVIFPNDYISELRNSHENV